MNRFDHLRLRFNLGVWFALCVAAGCNSELASDQNQPATQPYFLEPGIRLTEEELSSVTGIMFIHGDPTGEGIDLFRVEDSDIAQLAKATNLKGLCICESNVTSAGLGALRDLTRLEGVQMDHTNINDRALRHLVNSRGLNSLWLGATKITNDGVAFIAENFPNLRELKLNDTAIDDQAVMELAKLNDLVHLDLAATKLTDLSVPTLSKMTQLETLNISRRSTGPDTVSKKAAESIRNALPNTTVIHE